MDHRAEFSLHLYIKSKLIFFCIFIVDIIILQKVWTLILHKVKCDTVVNVLKGVVNVFFKVKDKKQLP